ncbi:MAG TPA: hypothetical protein VMG10_31150 [Gemmataceae bacterium]|nr:hypothetical protein [Gemmataceae bacterium]
MRIASLSRLALIAALIVAAGCSGNKGKIEDTTWVSRAAKIKGKPLPPGAQLLQFRPDGHLVYTVAGKQFKGHYALGMGPAVIFTLEEDLKGRKIHPHKIVIDGDELTLTSADGSELTFEKVKVPMPLG